MFRNPQKTRCRDRGRLLHALNHTLQWLLVSTVFGTVSSLLISGVSLWRGSTVYMHPSVSLAYFSIVDFLVNIFNEHVYVCAFVCLC